MRAYLGLSLLWLAVVYLTLTHPLFPGWLWGMLMAGVFLALARRREGVGLEESGVLLLGWSVGAMLSDFTGLRSLKLVGVGAALWALGSRSRRPELWYLGVAVAGAGALVGLFEVGAAPWVAVVLALFGAYLLLKDSGRSEAPPPSFEERYRKLVQWRLQEARRRGVRVDEVLSDEQVARLARARDRQEIEEILGAGQDERVEALLLEAQRVP